MSYCTPLDLIAHANRARLVGQLAGNDYAPLPDAAAVLDYFTTGNATPGFEEVLANLKARVEQAIEQASGDINGYLALIPDIKLPADTLAAACMDMALYRLFDRLDDDSVIKQLNDSRHVFFDRLVTGKAVVNRDLAFGAAQTVGPDAVFTAQTLEGY